MFHIVYNIYNNMIKPREDCVLNIFYCIVNPLSPSVPNSIRMTKTSILK